MTLRTYDGKPVDVAIYDGLVEFTVEETPEYKKGDQANARSTFVSCFIRTFFECVGFPVELIITSPSG